jgi:hypothetical protein
MNTWSAFYWFPASLKLPRFMEENSFPHPSLQKRRQWTCDHLPRCQWTWNSKYSQNILSSFADWLYFIWIVIIVSWDGQ